MTKRAVERLVFVLLATACSPRAAPECGMTDENFRDRRESLVTCLKAAHQLALELVPSGYRDSELTSKCHIRYGKDGLPQACRKVYRP